MMVKKYGKQYLNKCSTAEEKKHILEISANKGFSGCFASWDCKHFPWKNCPMRWAGQYQGHHEGGSWSTKIGPKWAYVRGHLEKCMV